MTEEDEAFEDIERRQGGFQAKRQMAADKLQEDRINYGTSWEKDGERIDPMSVYKEPVTKDEALKLALDALEHISQFGCNHVRGVCTCEYREAADAIKEALAQPAQEPVIKQGWDVDTLLDKPAQEPVAWITPDGEGFRIRFSPPTNDVPLGWDALYTAPPQRQWVGLTAEETSGFTSHEMTVVKYVSKVLQEKNHG